MYTVGNLLNHMDQSTVYFISPDLSITAARDYMKDKQVGAVSVKEQDELAGILTERDILWKCDLKDDLSLIEVGSIMTPVEDIVAVNPNIDLTGKHLMHLLIVSIAHNGPSQLKLSMTDKKVP